MLEAFALSLRHEHLCVQRKALVVKAQRAGQHRPASCAASAQTRDGRLALWLQGGATLDRGGADQSEQLALGRAGAGVRGGATIGATDRQAAYPISTKYAPWDVTATIFHALGIDPAGHFYDSSNRPYPISAGQPIAALFG